MDACLFLSPVYRDSTHGYLLCLGQQSNTAVTLRKDGRLVQTGFRPNIMNFLDPDDWWISWDNGVIAFGRGKFKGQQMLLQYEDPEPYHITGAQMLGGQSGAVAEWRMWEYMSMASSHSCHLCSLHPDNSLMDVFHLISSSRVYIWYHSPWEFQSNMAILEASVPPDIWSEGLQHCWNCPEWSYACGSEGLHLHSGPPGCQWKVLHMVMFKPSKPPIVWCHLNCHCFDL